MKRLASYLLLCSSVVAAIALPSSAQNQTDMQKGLSQLSAGQYAAALVAFESAVRKAPADLQARFCYAVCLHHLGRLSEARTEYQNVAKLTKDPALQRRANKGVQGCAGVDLATTQSSFQMSTAEPAGGEGELGGAGEKLAVNPFNSQTVMHPAAWAQRQQETHYAQPAPAAHTAPHAAPAAPQQEAAEPIEHIAPEDLGPMPGFVSTGVPAVIDIYTDWCGWCKKLEPLLKRSESRFGGRVEFRRLNAEAPENVELCKSLHVRGYPTVFYVTAQGRIVHVGYYPKSQEQLDDQIASLFNIPK